MRLSTRNAPLILALPLLLLAARAAAAQDAALGDQEKLGERLFNQSCGVCHLKQQIGTTTYAPALSQATLGGKAAVMHDVISDGSPHMPAFKIQFAPAQIDAIVAYIKTIPIPAAAPRPGKANGPGEAD
jgi:mono/diheme cytochrome c family protein